MVKNKYIGVAFVVLCAGGLGTGGYFVWHSQKGQKVNSFGAEAGVAASSNDDIALNQVGSGGLNVDSSAGSAGQLGSTSGQSLTGSSNSGSSNSSSSPTLPDPSTFAQYDKYKGNDQPLFGDIQVGTGAELGNNQKAAVYYKGFLTDGTVFDQSRPDSSGNVQPFVFTEGAHQVITGWEEGLAGMKVGGTRLLIVPPAVGYGAAAQGSIPANSVLVFEVQLAQVQ